MCTITLEYNKNNALARRKLAKLLSTGLFRQIKGEIIVQDSESLRVHREFREVILENSKRNMSHFIARNL